MSDKIQELKCILKNNGKENPFENKLLRMLIKALEQLQAKTDECEKLKADVELWFNLYKDTCNNMAIGDEIWAQRVKNAEQENTALKQQLDISVEALEKILDKCIYIDCLEEECTGMYEQCD